MSTPHFRYPFRFNSTGTADVVEQDSVEEILQSVQVVLTTTRGARIEVPNFGVPGFVFAKASPMPSDALVRAIRDSENRAQVKFDMTVDNVDQLIQHVNASVSMVGSVSSPSDATGTLTPDVVVDEGGIGYGAGGYGAEGWGG